MQAAGLFQQKIKPPEVARRLRVSLKSAYQWHKLWRDSGREALASRGPKRVAMPSVPALSGKARRVSGAGAGRARLGGGSDVDGHAGGHADRQEVPRLLSRLGCNEADAPDRLQPAGARTAGRRARRAGRHRVEGGDLGGGKRAGAACGGYICFEDEAGFTRRPPRGRTWGRRGATPVVTVSGRRSGRLSVAGLIAMRPGSRTRLYHRLRTHPAGKSKRRSMGERDFMALIDGVHQLVKAPIVLVWDRLNTHVSHAMRELIATRDWLTVFLLPAYSPDLNPVEWVWAHVKRSLANLAVVALDRLAALVGNMLKRQYRPDTLDGFTAGTGLTLDEPTSP